jgi:hypothetical protein
MKTNNKVDYTYMQLQNNNNNNNNNTHYLAKAITEKQNKYQELSKEVRDMWRQDTVPVVPTVISATGIIPKSLS